MGNETDDFQRRAQKSLEQLDAEHANDLPAGVLPVTWKDGATGRTSRGRPLQVIQPDAADIATFGNERAATCGSCKYYDLEGGRQQIIKQRFMERLVREEHWKPHHLGDAESAGICKQRPSMAVTYISQACDMHTPRKRR